ncbi:ABC transporter permease [Ekhidna sp.]|uniref:ABC transporter permease n=1 Tax=Ekhidna sp. TaxID=2608089 RepID=UPI003B5BA974
MDQWMNFPWIADLSVMMLSTLIVGLVSGAALLLSKSPAGRWMGLLLFADLSLLLINGSISDFQALALVLAIVVFFLYLRAFFYQKNRIPVFHYLILIGSGLLIVILNEQKLVTWIFGGTVLVFYVVLIFKLLLHESQSRGFTYFQNAGPRISWLRNFVFLQMLFLASFYCQFGVSIYCVLFLILLFQILYQLIRESSFLSPIPMGNKYKKSTLTPEIKSSIIGKLEEVMRDQHFYRRDDASLTTLAELLGVTNHHLSQVLNDSLKISFQDLLARFRVREACMLLRDEANDQVKIENIATQVGYNSKSAFNTAFKRRTGLTPSEYREAKGVLIYGEERLSEGKEPSNGDRTLSLNHVFKLKMNSDMIQHFFKIFSRNVKRNGLFSFLNVLGLTVGFTCSILIYLYVQDELSYDQELPDSDRIYRIAWMSDNPQTRTPHPMAQAMVSDFPEVEEAVSLSPWYGPGLSRDKIRVKNVKTNVIFEEPDFYFADSTLFDVFKLKVLEGDEDALKTPFSLVITEPMAKKYFGDSSAIGQELSMNDMALAVSAVVEPMPEHSHFHFNGIIPYVTLKQINPTSNWMTWADFGHFNYIRLKEGASHEALESKIPEWALGYINVDEARKEIILAGEERFELQPITSIHLNSHLRWELENNGNILYVYILLVVLGFLILIAAINYTNLTTAKSIERAKEIGVRKTLGAISKNLSGQFYLESILFSVFALCLSVFIVVLLLDGFNFISGKQFQVADLFNVSFLIKALILGVGVGLLAGFYPAVALSSFKPTEVLKGKLTTSVKGVRLRSALVILQFTISAILISGSLIIFNQLRYMKDKDLGFDQDAIISLNVPISVAKGNVDLEALRTTQNQLEDINGVRTTALTSSIPGGQFNQHPYFLRDNPEQRVDASELMVDYGIEKVLGFEVVQGRIFDRSFATDSVGGVIINETFAGQLNVENPVGKTLVQDASGREYEMRIIGVIKDFHFQSLHQEIQPLMMAVQPLGAGHLLVKLSGQQFGETIAKIEEIYNANIESELPFEYHFLDQELASLYEQEERTLSIFSIFSMIALILASLGLLGMAIAILNQRIKEVGMRKILGATSGQIMRMILGQFVRLVIVAIAIGLPLSYLLMEGWIAEFSYRAPVGIMPFIGAILILLLVAVISVISAVTKITYSNPVEALRYE